jgi:hypothetical protein
MLLHRLAPLSSPEQIQTLSRDIDPSDAFTDDSVDRNQAAYAEMTLDLEYDATACQGPGSVVYVSLQREIHRMIQTAANLVELPLESIVIHNVYEGSMHVVFAVLAPQQSNTGPLTPHELVQIVKKILLTPQTPVSEQEFPYLSHVNVNCGLTISSSALLIDLVAKAKLWVKDNWDDKTKKSGSKLKDLQIHENPAIASECMASKRFLLGLQSDLGPLDSIKSIPPGDQHGQVTFGYHAVRVESVVSAICHDGYDPQYRNGQAYARGEYFSKAGQEDYSINSYSGSTGLLVVNALLGGHFAHKEPHLVIANPVKEGWYEQGIHKVRHPVPPDPDPVLTHTPSPSLRSLSLSLQTFQFYQKNAKNQLVNSISHVPSTPLHQLPTYCLPVLVLQWGAKPPTFTCSQSCGGGGGSVAEVEDPRQPISRT